MSRITGANDFRKEVSSLLKEYGAEVMEKLEEAVHETAEQSAEELKSAGEFKGTKYRASWTVTEQYQKPGLHSGSHKLFASAVVHNTKHYRLTHLLEFGHAKQNGGRTRAFPHIEPVNEKAQKTVVELLERKLKE